MKPIPRTGTREMDPTLEADHGSSTGLNPQKLKLDQAGLTPSKKDQLEAQSSKTPTLPMFPQDPLRGDTPPPPPPPSPAKKHNTPKGSETEKTEEQQEKCQRARKWKVELQELKDYHESCKIFLHNLPEQGGCSHTGYLESRISEPGTGFFIKSFKAWWVELEKQSQGIRHSVISAHHKLQTLERMYGVKLSTLNNIRAEYLVEVFKYPRTRNCIPMDAEDGYGSTPMIGLYGLVEPYSIARITTTQSRVVTKDGKKKLMYKCYCSLYDYVVQNHPSINNHFRMHLHLSLLCTINGCFHIEHSCNDMWLHISREHNIPSTHMAVQLSKKSKNKK